MRDLESALASYTGIFGYKLQSGPYDDPIQKVSVCFLSRGLSGEPLVELVAPLNGGSPVTGVLKRGGGAYHWCYETQDLDRALGEAVEAKFVLISGPAPAVAFGGRRIAWVYAPTLQLLELLEEARPEEQRA